MTNILDRVAKSAETHYGHFEPTNAEELFSLRLATKLNDAAAAQHYVKLLQEHGEDKILTAYRRTVSRVQRDLARRFHVELKHLQGRNAHRPSEISIAAIRIERRAVGLAIFNGRR